MGIKLNPFTGKLDVVDSPSGDFSDVELDQGTATAPSISFNGDTNTGIYSPGPDQLAISTNGTERVEFGTGEVVFNDGGANYDFRIEGDTDSSLFFVDASTNRVGLGTSSPSEVLHVQTGSSGSVQIGADGPSQFAAKIFNPVSTLKLESTASDLILSSARHFIFQDENGAQFGRWASDGRLGIGITSPAVELEVVGDISCDGVYGQTDTNTSIQFPGSDVITFNEGGSEAARIDSSGRLLVGTSTAASTQGGNLQVDTSACIRRNVTSSGGPALRLEKTRASSDGTYPVVSSNDDLGEIQFYGSDGTKLVLAASILAEADDTPGADDMPGRLVFSTTADGASSPTPRMRISRNGQISTLYSDTYGLVLQSTQASSSSRYLIWGSHSATNITGAGATNVFQVQTDGDVRNTNNSYGAISDIKLKENIVDASSQWDDLKALQVRNYNFKAETGFNTHTQIGLIAQEAELVSPGLVSESPDLDEEGNDLGTVTKSVNYSVLYMKAVKALQEAMERIEQLEAKVAALEVS